MPGREQERASTDWISITETEPELDLHRKIKEVVKPNLNDLTIGLTNSRHKEVVLGRELDKDRERQR